jgi:hypothetical protein
MVYVDDMALPFNGWHMCHMGADFACELHAMAAALGLKRKWFQDPADGKCSWPHYDIVVSKRPKAIRLGAKLLTDRREIVHRFTIISRRHQLGLWDIL